MTIICREDYRAQILNGPLPKRSVPFLDIENAMWRSRPLPYFIVVPNTINAINGRYRCIGHYLVSGAQLQRHGAHAKEPIETGID